jgi:hypothetical protein
MLFVTFVTRFLNGVAHQGLSLLLAAVVCFRGSNRVCNAASLLAGSGGWNGFTDDTVHGLAWSRLGWFG